MTASRSVRLLAAAAAAASLLITGLSAPAARADTSVDGRAFGLHVPQLANGVTPTVLHGAIRLWDAGVSWGQVEQHRGQYWWVGLDHAVQAANAQNAQILYVLGSTPTWAALHRSQGTYPNRGAASNPRLISDWQQWVTAVVTRYGPSIDAYQIWNEANVAAFWQGTPREMARLTLEAQRIIRRLDPTALVVAASSTVRLTSAFNRFFPAYLKELRRVGWPVDVMALHTYGPSTATPALRANYVAQARADLRQAQAPALPLWDTEVNYGIAGPGSAYPHKAIGVSLAPTYVAQTYLDSVRLGIARTFWYSWSARSSLLGITMNSGYPGAVAYQAVYDWLVGTTADCHSRHVRICRLSRAGVPSSVAWTSAGAPGTFVVPPYATRMCDARSQCQAVIPGTRMSIGRMPRWFG